MNANKYTQKSMEAIQAAQELAIRNFHQQIEQIHLVQALLEQETLNRAEFVSLMETGKMPEATKEDKPRTAEEIIRESKEASEAEAKQETTDKAEEAAEEETVQNETHAESEA